MCHAKSVGAPQMSHSRARESELGADIFSVTVSTD